MRFTAFFLLVAKPVVTAVPAPCSTRPTAESPTNKRKPLSGILKPYCVPRNHQTSQKESGSTSCVPPLSIKSKLISLAA
jgi:hypothetical protein